MDTITTETATATPMVEKPKVGQTAEELMPWLFTEQDQDTQTPNPADTAIPDPGKPDELIILKEPLSKDLIQSAFRGVIGSADNTFRAYAKYLTSDVRAGYPSSSMDGVPGPTAVPGDEVKPWPDWLNKNTVSLKDMVPPEWMPDPSERLVGHFTEGVTQFVASMVGPRKALGAWQAASKTMLFAKEVLIGGAAMATGFDPYQERLANWAAEYPEFWGKLQPFIQWMAANPKDPDWVARGKAALEGSMADVAMLPIIAIARVAAKGGMKYLQQVNPEDAKVIDDLLHGKDGVERPFVVEETPDGFVLKHKETGEASPPVQSVGEALDQAYALQLDATYKTNSIVPWTPEEVVYVSEYAEAIKRGSLDEADELAKKIGVNFSYNNMSKDAEALSLAVADLMGDPNKAVRPTVETLRAADGLMVGQSLDDAVVELGKKFSDIEGLDAWTVVARLWVTKVGEDVAKLSRLVDQNPNDLVSMDNLRNAMSYLHALQIRDRSMSREIGRALRSRQIPIKAGAAISDSASEAENALRKEPTLSMQVPLDPATLDNLTPDQLRALARRIRWADGDPEAIARVVETEMRIANPLYNASMAEKAAGLRIVSMLWGTKTHSVQILSNLITTLQAPAEKWWAGVKSGNPALRQEGVDTFVGLFFHAYDSIRAAGRALKSGRPFLDPQYHTNEMINPFGDNVGGAVYNLSNRALMTEDEFFKGWNYRADIFAKALRDGRDLGLDGEALAQHVYDTLDASFSATGRGLNDESMLYARKNTFTDNPREGSPARSIQKLAKEQPALRIIIPFIRSSAALGRYTLERTYGINRVSRAVREDLAAGGERAALARAKQDFGTALYITAAGLALSHKITGGGPVDPRLRKQLMDARDESGNPIWRPYSIQTPNGFVEYRRADPQGMFLGLVADLVESSGEMSDREYQHLGDHIIASAARNLTSKTYMSSFSDLFETIATGNANKVQQFRQDIIGSYIPRILSTTDDSQREIRNTLDEVRSRLPGFSQTLPPRRNAFGDVVTLPPGWNNRNINPFTYSPGTGGDDLMDDLYQFGRSFPEPARVLHGYRDIDLADKRWIPEGKTQTPYDRMMQLLANPRQDGVKRGVTLKQHLRDAMGTKKYKDASAGDLINPGGTKFEILARIVDGHQKMAFHEMLKEYPRLREEYAYNKALMNISAAKGEDGVLDFLSEKNLNQSQ